MYPCASVYKQEQTLYNFRHKELTNYQLYEKFNTNSDSDNTIVVTIHHKLILKHVSQENHNAAFENITKNNRKK